MVNQVHGKCNGQTTNCNLFTVPLSFLQRNKEKQDDMQKRFVTIWFRYLKTDWFCRRHPELLHVPFVLTAPDHGRMIITSVNPHAYRQGIVSGMVLADARAIVPLLKYFDDIPGLDQKILIAMARWCTRFSPIATIDLPNGIIIDATGCTHLWNGEQS